MWDAVRRLVEWLVLVLSFYTKGRFDADAANRISALEKSAKQADEAAEIRQANAALPDRAVADKLSSLYNGRRSRKRISH